VFAIGNGKGSSEFRGWLQRLVAAGYFTPYVIRVLSVDEAGASVYSVSSDAKKDLPGMDCNLVSAVSLARRVLDPLSELVKIDPKSLGVGLYQHDLTAKVLDTALDAVVSYCVSEVGADLNTASVCVLQKIAGLGAKRAQAIVDFREKHGPFTNRSQLLLVKGKLPPTRLTLHSTKLRTKFKNSRKKYFLELRLPLRHF
jgi:competence ComEA-like helix-hairpin-helix protein